MSAMRKQDIIAIIVVIVLLLLAGAAILFAPPEVATAGIAFVTALAIPAVTNYYQRRLQIDADQRAQKALVYQELLDAYFDQMLRVILEGHKQSRTPPAASAEVLQKYHNVTKKLILWGGDNVVREYREYRQAILGQQNGIPRELPYALTGLETVLFAIREDLGYKNNGLTAGDLLAIFVNDTKEPSAAATSASPSIAGVGESRTSPPKAPGPRRRSGRR